MDQGLSSTNVAEESVVNGMEEKQCTSVKGHNFYEECKKNLAILDNTVGGLVFSIDNMREIIQGMAITIEQQDKRLTALMDMVSHLQSHVKEGFTELQNQVTPPTKKSHVPRSRGTVEYKIPQTFKRDGAIEKQEDKFTVIFDVSDDDNEICRKKTKGVEGKNDINYKVINPRVRHFAQTEREKVYGVQPSDKFTVKPGHSEFRRTSQTKGPMCGGNFINPKKLSFTPTTNNKVRGSTPQTSIMMEKGHILPENMESLFKVTADMQLTIEEMYMAAYVFHPQTDVCEEIFRMGLTSACVKDFLSLCPPRVPSQMMVSLISLKNTWLESKNVTHAAWFLPPYFNNDVRVGSTIESMVDFYVKEWMPTYSSLKYIYVPVEEITGQWYLMVLSIQEKIIYHLDPYFEDLDIIRRRDNIKTVSEVISQLIGTEMFPPNFANGVLQLDGWEISDAFSPSKWNGEHLSELISYSILWVMDWLYMRGMFQPNTVREMNTEILRMKIALDLLCGEHNEKWAYLQAKAKAFWVTSRYASPT